MSTLHVFQYLGKPADYPPARVCVLFGDEPFLKGLALAQLRDAIVGEGDEQAPYTTFDGNDVEWRDVIDELSTASLFGGGPRLAVIKTADDFVTACRASLESYVEKPRSTGVLLMEVSKWASNTRLYKAVDASGLQIDCRPPEAGGKKGAPDEKRIAAWLIDWSARRHGTQLEPRAAQRMFDLVGPEFGRLDQELAKLALFAGAGGTIQVELVNDVVGGWRAKTAWELLDAALDGDAGEALRQLDRLLQSGEHSMALFGPISWSLRRYAAATRIIEAMERDGGRVQFQVALEQAGIRRWPANALKDAERQLKQLGRERAGKFHQWLLETDLALKGSHSAPDRARMALELLLVRMAKELAPRKK